MIIKNDYTGLYKIIVSALFQNDTVIMINANSKSHALELMLDAIKRDELKIKSDMEQITITHITDIDTIF